MPIETRPPVFSALEFLKWTCAPGSLRKQGKRISSRNNPFKLLAVLLQRLGKWSRAKSFVPKLAARYFR